MQQPQRPFTLRLKPAAMMLALALTSMSVMPDAYAQPVRGSSLYYRMGGGSPGGSARIVIFTCGLSFTVTPVS